jgi:hypothetical protein
MTTTLYAVRSVVAAAATLALYFRCTVGTGLGPECALTIVKVDAPAQIGPGDALFMTVTVQYGWCSFESVVVTRTTDGVTLDARGRDDAGPGSRRADNRQQTVSVRVDPPYQDPFTIIARQPSGPPTTWAVRVR